MPPSIQTPEPPVFSTSRKLAQQTAHHLLAGHVTLTAWWALRRAGVFDAMLAQELQTKDGLDLRVHSTRTSMAHDVLVALVDYLAAAGLVTIKSNLALLSPEGKALYEHEDGVLELLRAYQPVLDNAEHLLAKLKSYGGPSPAGPTQRKSEQFADAQAKRHSAELFPAITDLVGKRRFSHVLDLNCGAGELLIHLAGKLKNIVGVGLSPDALAVRRANAAIAKQEMEKRFIAVPANPTDVLTETQRTFDRIGISRQLWNEIDCVIAPAVYSETAATQSDPGTSLATSLAATRKNFSRAYLLLIEPVSSDRFDKNYFAPELALLWKLTKSTPRPPEQWHALLAAARYSLASELLLPADGLALFLCKPV